MYSKVSSTFYDEMYAHDGIREGYQAVAKWLSNISVDELTKRRAEAEAVFRRIGITFAVYGEGGDPERLIPFDPIPRVFTSRQWDRISAGVIRRAEALNAFIADVYNEGRIFKDGVIPQELVLNSKAFQPLMKGFRPPQNVYCHITGIDIVRTGQRDFFILEDNCRTPSGVSYMLENRAIMTRLFPKLFKSDRIQPVDGYPDLLRKTLNEVAPEKCKGKPTIAVLTPGHYNSAYYEHSFIAEEMGVPLLVGSDLFVDDGLVYMRTTQGPERVDVIYRRIDDDFLDPTCFRPDSTLGVPGIMNAYLTGGVTLVNAPGTGIADDKAIYSYMDDIARYYQGEPVSESRLTNDGQSQDTGLEIPPDLGGITPAYRCRIEEECRYALDHMDKLVFKEVQGSGGYGMLIGPHASTEEIEAYRKRVIANPAEFIAQPMLALSTCPTLTEKEIAPRHVDFRPFALTGKEVRLTPGGLTRVAMKEGSLVVNSSQGGGVKDTWVLKP